MGEKATNTCRPTIIFSHGIGEMMSITQLFTPQQNQNQNQPPIQPQNIQQQQFIQKQIQDGVHLVTVVTVFRRYTIQVKDRHDGTYFIDQLPDVVEPTYDFVVRKYGIIFDAHRHNIMVWKKGRIVTDTNQVLTDVVISSRYRYTRRGNEIIDKITDILDQILGRGNWIIVNQASV